MRLADRAYRLHAPVRRDANSMELLAPRHSTRTATADPLGAGEARGLCEMTMLVPTLEAARERIYQHSRNPRTLERLPPTGRPAPSEKSSRSTKNCPAASTSCSSANRSGSEGRTASQVPGEELPMKRNDIPGSTMTSRAATITPSSELRDAPLRRPARKPAPPGSRATRSRRRRTAFVLSGGASLGALQVGMVRALYERGVTADLLVGTSVGALNAAFIASRPQTPETARELGRAWHEIDRGEAFPLSLRA